MTPRQSKLLFAIINEFIQSAEAVGSLTLCTKYKLNLSPATIRNEMAELMHQGYLAKLHTSSGRVPTIEGYKHFIDRIYDELDELENSLAIYIREELFQSRFDPDELIYRSLNFLVEHTDSVAIGLLGNRIYHVGLARIPTLPEYRDAERLSNLIQVIEDRCVLYDLLTKFKNKKKVRILFGDDTGIPSFGGMVIVYSPIRLYKNNMGYIGVVGPQRMNYLKTIPLVEYIADNIQDVVADW